jgi:hypothetical protein
MATRSVLTTISELESLIAKFKESSYNDASVVDEMLNKIFELKNTFVTTPFSQLAQFGSEFTPDKKRAPRPKTTAASDSDESSSLSESESESSEEEEKVPKKKPALKVSAKKKPAFGGGGGSSASDSSDSDSGSDSEERPVVKRKKMPLKKKRDPLAPKRPMSAYLIYSQDKRAEVKQAHPDWKLTDTIKHLAMKWKDMPDAEKEVYVQKAGQEKKRYEEEMRQYEAKNSAQEESPKKSATPKKEARSDVKKPLSAFMLFVRDKRQEVKSQKPELSFGDLSMELAQMWKGLSDDGKKIWLEKAHEDLIRYQNELKQ